MKKHLGIVACSAVLFGFLFCNAYALDENSSYEIIQNDVIDFYCEDTMSANTDISDMHVKLLTESDYANSLVENNGYSHEKAEATADAVFSNLSSNDQVIEYYRTVSKAGYEVTYGARVRCASGPQPTFQEVLATYANASGMGQYTWTNNGDPVAYIVSPVKLQLVGSGIAEVVVNTSTSTSGGVKVDLGAISANADSSYSIGTTTYYRLRLDWNTYITLNF